MILGPGIVAYVGGAVSPWGMLGWRCVGNLQIKVVIESP